MPNKTFDVCANCKHYEQYYHESGWCDEPTHSSYFPRGLMVYAWNGCELFNNGGPRERQVDDEIRLAEKEARAEAAFATMRASLGG